MTNKGRKRAWTFILSVALILSLIPVYPTSNSYAADTTPPYVSLGTFILPVDQKSEVPDGYIGVYTKEDLDRVRENLSANYILMNDITFLPTDFTLGGPFSNGGHRWNPLGNETTPFKGIFEGNGHIISGIESREYQQRDVGLFGRISQGAQILNLGMSNCVIQATTAAEFTGTIVGFVESGCEVRNCYNTGKTSGANATFETYTGGIAGGNAGNMSYCNNTGNPSTQHVPFGYVGGIAGYNVGAIAQSFNVGLVEVTYASGSSGGVAGKNNGTIDECYNTGSVSVDTTLSSSSDRTAIAGGIAGIVTPSGIIKNTLNTGLIYKIAFIPNEYAGGIAAINDGLLQTSYSIGFSSVNSGVQSGCVAGTSSGVIESCYRYEKYGQTTFGTPLSLDALQSMDSFVGFDFAQIWGISDVSGYPAPALKSLGDIKYPDDTKNFSGGDGSLFNPYRLSKVSDLLTMYEYPFSHFLLVADIAPTSNTLVQSIRNFHGTFDGNGHSISGIVVSNSADTAKLGLFGTIEYGGLVKDLTMSTVIVSRKGTHTGGIAGSVEAGGKILRCTNLANLPVKAMTGGICGVVDPGGEVIDCVNEGDITVLETSMDTGSFYMVGGVVGFNAGTVRNAVNNGDVTVLDADYCLAGGIAGKCDGVDGLIIDSENNGAVSATVTGTLDEFCCQSFAGGITAHIGGTIKNTENNGAVTAVSERTEEAYAAGIAAMVYPDGQVLDTYNTGAIHGTSHAGGIVAFTNGRVLENYNTGAISGENYIGGLVGYYRTGWIDDCYSLGNIPYSENADDVAGGFNPDAGEVPGDNYYLDETGTGEEGALTEEELSEEESYVGFDFVETWEMSPSLKKPVHQENPPETYPITYVLNGGTLAANTPTEYMLGSNNRLTTPRRNGYAFMGWYESADFSGPKIYVIPVGSNTSKKYYAKWGAPIVAAKSTSYNSIKVYWAAAGGATSYKIYRSISATGTYSLVHTSLSTSRAWTNTGLVTGKTYYYRIYPVAGGTTYKFSTTKSAKAIPETPTVTLAKASSTSIKVTWTGVSGATKYQIYRAGKSSSSSTYGDYKLVYTASSSARSWIDTGRHIGSTYKYKVRAYHLEGTTKVYGGFSAAKYFKL